MIDVTNTAGKNEKMDESSGGTTDEDMLEILDLFCRWQFQSPILKRELFPLIGITTNANLNKTIGLFVKVRFNQSVHSTCVEWSK